MNAPLANIQPDEVIRRYSQLLAARTDECIRLQVAAEALNVENQRLIMENQELLQQLAERDHEVPLPPPVDAPT